MALVLVSGCAGPGLADEQETPRRPLTRVVEHAFGTTEVPYTPSRVVVLDGGVTLEAALAVGAPVIAATPPQEPQSFTGLEWADISSQVTSLPESGMLADTLRSLTPGIVLMKASEVGARDRYDDLRKEFPVVAIRYDPGKWREHLKAVAEAIGVPERARNKLDTIDRTVAGHDFVGRRRSVAFAVKEASGDVRPCSTCEFARSLLATVGVMDTTDAQSSPDSASSDRLLVVVDKSARKASYDSAGFQAHVPYGPWTSGSALTAQKRVEQLVAWLD